MTIPYFIVDSFTPVKFKGNPAAVCIPGKPLPAALMLSIAREFGLPVTAFVEEVTPHKRFRIRYFTVTSEIPACGHATLAAARLFIENASHRHIRFETNDQVLIDVNLHSDIIYMSYPRYETVSMNVNTRLLQSLGLNSFRWAGFCKELETLFIEMDDPVLLRGLKPDFRALEKSSDAIIEVVVTSVSDNMDYDYILRSFCPWIGIDEDPVTGSVHAVLAGYWKERLGKHELSAYQASERGGEVFVRACAHHTEIGGRATLTGKGQLFM